ncbi:MAG: glycoside hydrolase family 13 [Bacteroidota bacterium]
MSLVKKYSKDKKKCNVTFTLPQEALQGGNQVVLVGEFNDWNPAEGVAMIAKKGAYQTVLKLETGKKYEYRYLVDGHLWTNDATPDAFVSNPFGTVNSVVTLDAPATKVTKVGTKTVAKKTTKKATTKAISTKDNLKKIEGVGPKIEKLLNADGINTFAELGKTKIAVLRNILAEAGPRYKMHNPSTWAKQARLAAKGDWEKLQILQDELNGGV